MAPEQRVVDSALSERTDIYSLGLLLYELLAGHHASAGSRRATPPPAPSTVVPDVHPQLERVIMQALSPAPEDRQASAAEFAAGLPDIGVWRDETETRIEPFNDISR